MPTFSSIGVEKIASTKEKSAKQKKRSPIDDTEDRPAASIEANKVRPRFASPILYTTPKTTSLPYIARSFTASPYVINHKRRVPPSTVVAKRIEAKDAVAQNGFLLVDGNQECGDAQQGKIEKLGNNGVDLVKNDENLARNGESLMKIDGNLVNCDRKRAIEEIKVSEGSVVAERMRIRGEILVENDERLIKDGERLVNDEENTALEEVRVREECRVAGKLVINGENWNSSGGYLSKDVSLVKNDENRGIEEVRVRAAGKLVTCGENSVYDGKKLVHGDECRAIDNVRVTEESWVAEKNAKTEKKKIVNPKLSIEIRSFEVGGASDVLKSFERDQVDDGSTLAADEGSLKPYSCSTEFSPRNMEVCFPANGKENLAVALNMKKFPISGWSKAKTTYGRSEGGDVAESECFLKNNGDAVFQRSPGDGDYTPRTNRTDFFDAEDDLFSEDEVGQSTKSFNSRIQAELDSLRSKISKESEQRIKAEEALSVCQTIWQELVEKFSAVGLALPSIEIGACQGVDTTVDVINDACGQLTIARSVANAVGRASIRAGIECEFKVLIDDKNSEISRLHDKLMYYELVNHEMSQRNQEAMELARRRRQRHKKKQRWIWGSFAVSVAIGTTALAYTYIPWAQMKDRMPVVCSRSNIQRMASTGI